MDIKATQIKNNTQIIEASSSSVRTPAKVTEEGKSFIDEMVNLPKFDVENNIQQPNVSQADTKTVLGKETKNFEFISIPENDFKGAINKENLTVADRQAKHKAAEKELVDEIVLMNNKQNAETKNIVKNDLNKAQVSVSQKNENQIEAEKNEINKDLNKFFKHYIKQNELNQTKQEIQKFTDTKIKNSETVNSETENEPVYKFVESEIIKPEPEITDNISKPEIKDCVKPELDTLDIVNVEEKAPEIEVLKMAEDVADEIILPDKNAVEEFFEAPEKLEQFEEPLNMLKPEISSTKENKPEKTEATGVIANEKALENEEKIAMAALPKVEVTEKEQPDKIVEKNVNVQPKVEVSQKETVKNSNIENLKQTKIEEPKLQKNEDIKTEFIAENEVIQDVKTFEKPEKAVFVENLLNQNKIDEKLDKKSEKPKLNKIANTKNEAVSEAENIGKVKDMAEDINVKAVDVKPAIPEDIKVIKMEVVNPLAELNNSLNTTKTSDIVKFIDANLSTETAKTSKASSSKAAEAAKKTSSEKTIKMTEADAKFFNNLIETNQQVIEGTKTAEQTNNTLLKDVETAQSAQVSKSLLNALKESQETNKAFRVDFDKDISVVLKVNRDGQISAEFIPGDEAVEQYLKANIPLLKQKFTDEGLEYDSLSYRQHKKEQNEKERQSRGNKKENGYE